MIPMHHSERRSVPHMEMLEPRLLLSTWYVRPYGGANVTYGAENGTSYDNAWDGLSSVVWGDAGVKAGDTLYVCGTHPDPKVSPKNGPYFHLQTILTVGASGTAGNPITIRGDYAGDPGRIIREQYQWEFDAANPTQWTKVHYTSGGYDFYYYYRVMSGALAMPLEMNTDTGAVNMLTKATAAPGTDPAQWAGNGVGYQTGSNGTYYYKPTSTASDFHSMVYMDNVGTAIKIVGKDYITVQSLTMHGGAGRGMVWMTDDADHITLDRLTVQYSSGTAITVDRYNAADVSGVGAACDFGEIKNCFLNWAQSGIYTISGSYRHSDWWIHNNTIINMFQDDRNGAIDYHGICLEGGSNHVVEYNVIKHVGTVGILLDCKEGSTLPADRNSSDNVIIRWNWVEDVKTKRYDNGSGIINSTTFNNHLPDNFLNDQVYYNVCIGCYQHGFHGTAMGQPSSESLGAPWLVANNVWLNNGITPDLAGGYPRPANIYVMEPITLPLLWDGGFSFYNQIIADSPAKHVWARTADGLDADMDFDYNIYDAEGTGKWTAGDYPPESPVSHPYDTLHDWQVAQGKDLHSVVADSRFVDENAKDYRLQWNSPAIDAGYVWWTPGQIKTYTGSIIDLTDLAGMPIYGKPDIGAYEYQPPYMMGTDTIAANSSVRIYGDGKFRQLTAGATAASLAVAPVAGWGTFTATQQRPEWMDLAVTTWQTSGSYTRVWTETGSALGSTATAHTIGGLAPNTNYNLAVNGGWGSGISGSGVTGGLIRSDASGQITFNYSGGYASAQTFTLSKAVWGDFNNDGVVNAADIDALSAEIRTVGNRGPFDLTLDGQVSQPDMDNLVQMVLKRDYGDADLNGMVDQRDYAAWFNHSGQNAGWAGGDFTGDNVVDHNDFKVWFEHNAFVQSGVSAVFAAMASVAGMPPPNSSSMPGMADVPATKPITSSWISPQSISNSGMLDVLSMPALGLALS